MKKRIITLIACLFISFTLEARMARLWSYADLEKESDLILICRVDSPTTKTEKRSKIQVERGNYDEVLTGFVVESIFKGTYKLKYFQLHHLAYPANQFPISGCQFSTFPQKDQFFLIFLKREDDQWTPTSGYCDSRHSFIQIPQDGPFRRSTNK